MSNPLPQVLFIGYGNPGRLDDGLGPALAARIEDLSLRNVTVEAGYQLAVEDAFDVSRHDIVIFADAAVKGKAPFFFKEIHPRSPRSIGSHSVSPEAVLFFAKRLFHSKARAYVLGIRGYEFNGYNERLSERAEKNLEEAFQFMAKLARSGNFNRRYKYQNDKNIWYRQDGVKNNVLILTHSCSSGILHGSEERFWTGPRQRGDEGQNGRNMDPAAEAAGFSCINEAKKEIRP